MTTAGKSHPLAIGGLITLTLIWSYSWIAMKQVTHYIGAFDFTALRCSFGALLLFIVLLLRGRGMRPTPFGYTLAIALLQTCGMVGLSQWALVSGGAGKVAILSYTMPFWVVIMAAIFLGERMRRLQYFAIAVAAAGLLLVLQPWQLNFASMQSALLAILSGISWGGQRDCRQANVYPPSEYRSVSVDRMADAVCRAGDEPGGLAGSTARSRLATCRFLGISL